MVPLRLLQTRPHAWVAAALLALWLPQPAAAQPYPTRPIKVVMAWSDGFPANSTRLFAKELSERLKQPVVVEIQQGAGGEVAARHVKNAARDGYTLLATGTSVTTSWALRPGNVDPGTDLQPIAQLVATPYVIVSRAGAYADFDKFLEGARDSRKKLNYASPGVGSGMHFLGEMIKTSAGIDMVHIPYASGARQLQALLAGDVDIAIISLVTALPQIRIGKLDALAVSTATRSPELPAVPTLTEKKLRGVPAISSWIALFGPAGLPADILDALSSQITAAAGNDDVRKIVASWGAEVPDTRRTSLEHVVQTEKALWSKVAKEKNIVDPN